MFTPVQIEKGDYIGIDVVENILWIERERDVQTTPISKFPEPPNGLTSGTKRHYPTLRVFAGVKNEAADRIAFVLAYTVAWVAGFRVGNDTELFLETKNIYVYQVL